MISLAFLLISNFLYALIILFFRFRIEAYIIVKITKSKADTYFVKATGCQEQSKFGKDQISQSHE